VRRFFGGVGAAALVAVVAIARGRPPRPLGEGAPPAEFSAGRARRILETLAGDGRPHPEGSPEAAAVRDRVAAAFRALEAYDPASNTWEVLPSMPSARHGMICPGIEDMSPVSAAIRRSVAALPAGGASAAANTTPPASPPSSTQAPSQPPSSRAASLGAASWVSARARSLGDSGGPPFCPSHSWITPKCGVATVIRARSPSVAAHDPVGP